MLFTSLILTSYPKLQSAVILNKGVNSLFQYANLTKGYVEIKGVLV